MGVSVVTISIEEFENLIEAKKKIEIIKRILERQQKKKERIRTEACSAEIVYNMLATENAFTIGEIKRYLIWEEKAKE